MSAKPQVQVTGPFAGSWAARVIGLFGGAQRRAGGGERLERLVNVPARVGELERQRDVAWPGIQCGDQAAMVESTARHVQQHRAETLAEPTIRVGQPGDAFARIARHRPERAAALGLDREPECRWRRGEP